MFPRGAAAPGTLGLARPFTNPPVSIREIERLLNAGPAPSRSKREIPERSQRGRQYDLRPLVPAMKTCCA
jgi:hypothetical protein